MKEVALKEREVETQRFAQEIGIAHINLEKFPISQVALRQLTQERAKETATICFFATRDEVRVGSIDPTTDEAKEILAEIKKQGFKLVLITNGTLVKEKNIDYIFFIQSYYIY